MTSIEKKLNSLIYPIYGHIRWELENVFCGQSDRSSDRVKIGKTEWSLHASYDSENEKVLEIGFLFHTGLKGVQMHRVLRLINQQDQREDMVYETDLVTPRDWGDYISIKRSVLISCGFVKDGKMIVECSVRIDSEDGVKRRAINFEEERPNEEDLRMILEKRELPEKVEKVIEVPISLLENWSSKDFTLFGLPATLEIEEYSNLLDIHLDLNSDDESDWWRCLVHTQLLVVNHDDEHKSLLESSYQLYQRSETGKREAFSDLNEILDPSKGFVKDGNLTLKLTVRMLEWYGFDEKTNRGIEKPMRRMTDVVLKVRWQKYNVAKKVLAQQSSYFRDLFASNPEQSEFAIKNLELEDFEFFLELVHNDTYIREENVERVLEVINRFEAPKCFERCALFLKKKEFKDPMKMLDWLDKYTLPGLIDDDFIWSILLSRNFIRMRYAEKKEILDRICLEDMSVREEQTTDFKEETGLTDVKIEVDGIAYYASKQIVSNASYYFMKRFYGPYSEDETVISDLEVSSSNFELLLTHIYHPTRSVTSANIDSLLQLAHQFSVPRLMDKCEEYLVLNDSVSLIDKLEYAGEFNLPFLLEACLKFAKDTEKMSEVKSDSKYSQLPENVRNEITKRESGELQ